MTQKRNCERCRALLQRQGYGPKCELGHPLDAKHFTPTEPCEKPLTYNAYIEALRNYRLRNPDC